MTTSAGIVWLASYHKSGNTWFRILLANLAADDNRPADINDLNDGIASSRHEFETATMLDSSLLSHDDIDCLRPRVYEALAAQARLHQRWIKVHDAYSLTSNGEPLFGRNVARAAIYMVRDPRDVAVSLAHHNNMTIDEIIGSMNAADSAVGAWRKALDSQLRQKLSSWSNHVTSWLDQTDVPVHMVRYEDIVATPAECFGAALKFAGRFATRTEIDRAVRHSAFSELQRQESEKGFGERTSRAVPFFRSGRAGGWRASLTAAQAEAIEQCHGVVMTRLGYELEKR